MVPEVGTVGLGFMRFCVDSCEKSTEKSPSTVLYIDVISRQQPRGIERIEECASSSSARVVASLTNGESSSEIIQPMDKNSGFSMSVDQSETSVTSTQ